MAVFPKGPPHSSDPGEMAMYERTENRLIFGGGQSPDVAIERSVPLFFEA